MHLPPSVRESSRIWPTGREGPEQSIHGLEVTPTIYHDLLHSEAAVFWMHKLFCHALGLAMQYDRLNVTNVASQRLVSWRLVMIERAVKLNPKAPSFAGLHGMIDHTLSEGGGVTTKDLTSHLAEVAENEARILKQYRLLSKVMESGQRKQEAGQREGSQQRVTRDIMRCALDGAGPPSADTSWRIFSLLKERRERLCPTSAGSWRGKVHTTF